MINVSQPNTIKKMINVIIAFLHPAPLEGRRLTAADGADNRRGAHRDAPPSTIQVREELVLEGQVRRVFGRHYDFGRGLPPWWPSSGGGVSAYPRRQRKWRIGCSSIAFGATPSWPCWKSKNATPVTRARAHDFAARRAVAISRW